MSGRGGVIVLASYPKSGNTWLRCLADSLSHDGGAPDDGRLGTLSPSGGARGWLEGVLDLDLRDVSSEKLVPLRAAALRQCATERKDGPPLLLKVHDLFHPDLFPADGIAAVIHVVRDPRDVAPSLAHHLAVSLDGAIERMGDPGFALARQGDFFRDQALQVLGSWSSHTLSWLKAAEHLPTTLLRYEDMLARPRSEVAVFADILGILPDPGLIERAVAACSFSALRQSEDRSGFRERPAHMERFFRQGQAGAWASTLSRVQIDRIQHDHGAVMSRLGYALG